ncbi:probable methyltransferase-like protein 15 isoform X1 [Tachysurus ichikawai]
MTSFGHVFLSSLRLACCGKRRMHKCAYSNSWRKPNQTQSFCSSSSFTPDCQSRSTKHLSLPADQEPHTPVLLKEVLQYMDIKPGQLSKAWRSGLHFVRPLPSDLSNSIELQCGAGLYVGVCQTTVICLQSVKFSGRGLIAVHVVTEKTLQLLQSLSTP